MRLYSHGSDVLIVGAGIIGLSLAIELRGRGASVSIQDLGRAGAQASTAAAGMLAVRDPHHPQALRPIAEFSGAAYPGFLRQIEELSGQVVPLQTEITLQTFPDGQIQPLAEHSIDPRQLLPALRQAALRVGVCLYEGEEPAAQRNAAGVPGSAAFGNQVVHTTGAWTRLAAITPRKGQMLRVAMASHEPWREVHRAEHVYIVPRTQGPQAGTALIGATIEDAGFDVSTDPEALRKLRAHAAELLPRIADERAYPALEAWAGLRPATPDGLPLLGRWKPPGAEAQRSEQFLAAGHFRNGILLAPATALVMADLLQGRTPAVDLGPFSGSRFAENSG